MAGSGHRLFDTALGRCGIAWSERGIAGVQLPEANDRLTRSRLLQRHAATPPEATPPPTAQYAIEAIRALLAGESRPLDAIALDMDGIPAFHRQVYEAARRIGPGATLTYGELAERLGTRTLARAVGQALGHNPFPIVVPCHRVLAASGKLGGFSAHGGAATKLRLLTIESALLQRTPDLFASLS